MMLLKEFPDIHWLKTQIESRFEGRKAWDGSTLPTAGWPTVLMNARTQNTIRDNVKGPLSVFTNISGTSLVSASNIRASLRDDVFFISNAGEPYTLEIKQHVETFNIHIGETLASEVFYHLQHDSNYLLDNPVTIVSEAPVFYSRLYWRTPAFNQLIHKLNVNCHHWEETDLMGSMIALLLSENNNIREKTLSLSVAKKTTREEIVRRLLLTTDYLYTNYAHEISLDTLANIGCLSKFHFLRLFKEFFGESPHQFLLSIRLRKAVDLLRERRLTVKEIAFRTGFKDASSFSRLFHNKMGVYPLAYH